MYLKKVFLKFECILNLVSGPLSPPNKFVRDLSFSDRRTLTTELCGMYRKCNENARLNSCV